jgi:cell division protease FtsH
MQQRDFTEALEKILLGAPHGVILPPDDRRRTAYHEAGRALVGMLTPSANPVRSVDHPPWIVARRYLSVESMTQIFDARQFEESTLEQQPQNEVATRNAA